MKLIYSHLLCCVATALVAACDGGGSSAPSVIPVTITPAMASVMVDQQIQLAATVADATGNVVTGRVVTWTSSNAAVATVDQLGLVKALALGQVTITATTDGNSGMAALTTTTGLNFVTLTAGGRHTCGVARDDKTYCWGDNTFGQLGNATTTSSAAPVFVRGGLAFRNGNGALSAGDRHTCGLTVSGIAYCWGNNTSGQLGNGTTINSTVPVLVEGGLGFIAISAGGRHTCGITLGGETYCWGDNTSGQLGNETTADSAIPVLVSSRIGFLFISAGARHTCATASSAGIWCWGDNSSGQLGNGTTTRSLVPVLATLTPPLAATLPSAGDNHTCAVFGDPRFIVYIPVCWGGNSSGQLGDGTTIDRLMPPPPFEAGARAGGSAGTRFTCSNSSCVGDNAYGQLGNGTTTNSVTPVPIAGGLQFQKVSTGGRHACGVIKRPLQQVAGDAVYCWGDNSHGQLGNGWTTISPLPVNVAGGE